MSWKSQNFISDVGFIGNKPAHGVILTSDTETQLLMNSFTAGSQGQEAECLKD